MGYPAPLTRHVTLSINGENMGVYLETERIDRDFFVRNGLSEGAVFKAVESPARLVPFSSGHPPFDGFECRSGDEYGCTELMRLIGDVCWGGDFEHGFDSDCFIGNMAANLAMVDLDCCVKNYYLVLGTDGVWRYFPWDHDASFGNDWRGVFSFSRVNTVYYQPMYMNTVFTRLLTDDCHRLFFGLELDRAADCMEFDLPGIADSVRTAIRDDVYLDPLRQGTPADFEGACDSLILFVSARAAVVRNIFCHHDPPDSMALQIAPGWITPDAHSVSVTVISPDSLNWCQLWMVADGMVQGMTEMQVAHGSGGTVWNQLLPVRSSFDRTMRFFLYYRQATLPEPAPTLFYPPYGVFLSNYHDEVLPATVRVDRAPIMGLLVPGNQLRFGPSLWALPLVNAGRSFMDLSLCHVRLGDPAYRVFFPDSISLAPGETLFVTNDAQSFCVELRRRLVVGDCAAPTAAGSPVVLCDPSWTPVVSHDVPDAERHIASAAGFPLITELSYSQPQGMNSGDWLECYNPSAKWLDMSHARVSDSNHGSTVIPPGTLIPPGGFLIFASDPYLFRRAHPRVPCVVTDLGFNLSSESETIRFTDRSGVQCIALAYGSESPWENASGAVLSLKDPLFSPLIPESWEVLEYPGTPGAPNPAWNVPLHEPLAIRYITPVPATGGPVVFSISSVENPVTAHLADLTGRIVHSHGILEPGRCEYILDVPADLPSGMFFLVVQSSGIMCSQKLILLH